MHAAFVNSTLINKVLIILCIAAVIVIFEDRGSKFAAEENEMGSIIGICDESLTEIILAADYLPDVNRPILFEISHINFFANETNFKNYLTARGPPSDGPDFISRIKLLNTTYNGQTFYANNMGRNIVLVVKIPFKLSYN